MYSWIYLSYWCNASSANTSANSKTDTKAHSKTDTKAHTKTHAAAHSKPSPDTHCFTHCTDSTIGWGD